MGYVLVGLLIILIGELVVIYIINLLHSVDPETTRIMNKRDAMQANQQIANFFHLSLHAIGIIASHHPLFALTTHTQKHINRILEKSEPFLNRC